MSDANSKQAREVFVAHALEATIRVGIVLLLAAWCFQIVRPFVAPVLWGLIVAVATRPIFTGLEKAFGGRSRLAAVAFVVAGLLLIIGPLVALSATAVDGAEKLGGYIGEHGVKIPPPPAGVKDWPVVGGSVFGAWDLAHSNLTAALQSVESQLKTVGGWLLGAAASAGFGILMFAAAILVAAVFHLNAEAGERFAHAFAERLAGSRGPALAELAESTVRGVTKGILGVALIQALMAGAGMAAVGVPAAGLWALAVMVLAVIQLPSLIVMLPVALYVFQVESTGIAIAFAVWAGLIGVSDNILKPILLSGGGEVPMLVIFVGALGGFASSGIIGLFLGAIVLSVGYKLFVAWLERADVEELTAEAAGTAST